MLQQGGEAVGVVRWPPGDRHAVVEPGDPDGRGGHRGGIAGLGGRELAGHVLRLARHQRPDAAVEQAPGECRLRIKLEYLPACQLVGPAAGRVAEPGADVIDAEIGDLAGVVPDGVREDEPVEQAIHQAKDPGRPVPGRPVRVGKLGGECMGGEIGEGDELAAQLSGEIGERLRPADHHDAGQRPRVVQGQPDPGPAGPAAHQRPVIARRRARRPPGLHPAARHILGQ